MKRIDAVLFNGELDMLECRLRTLDPIIDRFVIAEATQTFTGIEKPVILHEHSERFAPWWDRITHVVVDDLPTTDNAWAREKAQREAIKRGLDGCEPDDIFILSDVDEIPSVEAIRICDPQVVLVFEQRFHPFAVDWLHPLPWQGTVACHLRDVTSVEALRYARLQKAFPTIKNAGHHFTWVGGDNETKLRSFSHTDLVPEITEFGLERFRKVGMHVDHNKLAPVTVDESWPAWIFNRECPADWFRP